MFITEPSGQVNLIIIPRDSWMVEGKDDQLSLTLV